MIEFVLITIIVVLVAIVSALIASVKKNVISLNHMYVAHALTRYAPGDTSDIILRADVDGSITSVSETVAIIGNYAAGELIGKNLEILNSRLDDGKSELMWDIVRNKHETYGFTIAGKDTANTPFFFTLTIIPVTDTSEKIVGYLGVHAKEQEIVQPPATSQESDEIARSRAHAEAILASIADGVLVTNQHGDITMINQAGREMLGVSESIGASVIEILPLEDDKGTLLLPENHPVYEATRGQASVTTKNFVYVRADFTKLWLAITTAPIVFEGNVEGVVAVLRDATLEKQIDRSKTEFVSLASHQLRTPLTAINWYTELLLDHGVETLTADQKSFVDQIRESSGRMNELVSSLLNVSRLELGTFSVDPVPTDVAEIVQSVLAELQPSIAEKQHTLNLELDETLEQIPVDVNLIRIVIQNLLSNAVKYTREKGSITVKLYRHYPEMRFEVIDNGYGIPHNQHDKIFTKLFRADNVVEENLEGNGLGLYIVRSILEQTGGDVWFESEVNVGTTFYVSVPLIGMQKKEGTKTLI